MDNSKVVIIFGKDDEKGNFYDGEIESYGDARDADLHIATLLEIANKYFSDDPIISRLNIRHQANIAAYFMVELGHVVFLNTTSYKKEFLEKHGKNGLLMVPDQMSIKQFETLKEFLHQVEDYTITVCSSLKLNEGFLESKNFTSIRGANKELVIDKLNSEVEKSDSNIAKY